MKKNRLKLGSILSVFVLVVVVLSCNTGRNKGYKEERIHAETQAPIMVFAAASLSDVLSEIIDSFEVQYQVNVQTNMASSGTLARQIEQGGAPDLFISASIKWADYVDSLGYFLPGTKKAIAKNDLVIIAPLNSMLEVPLIDSSLHFVSLIGQERLSLGDPAHVPAGKYAQQALAYFGWYEQLNGKILPAKDVRSALMVVEMDESPLGIVYRTDALKSTKVKILNVFPENSHKPVVYMGGVCKDKPVAKALFDYVNSEATKAIWLKYGFKR